MAQYYTPKLTEAQYLHVLDAMGCYGTDIYEGYLGKKLEQLHERTTEVLMKAQERKPRKSNGQT